MSPPAAVLLLIVVLSLLSQARASRIDLLAEHKHGLLPPRPSEDMKQLTADKSLAQGEAAQSQGGAEGGAVREAAEVRRGRRETAAGTGAPRISSSSGTVGLQATTTTKAVSVNEETLSGATTGTTASDDMVSLDYVGPRKEPPIHNMVKP